MQSFDSERTFKSQRHHLRSAQLESHRENLTLVFHN